MVFPILFGPMITKERKLIMKIEREQWRCEKDSWRISDLDQYLYTRETSHTDNRQANKKHDKNQKAKTHLP